MKEIWLLYYSKYIKKNQHFITEMTAEGRRNNIKDIKKPDAVISRVINPALSKRLEDAGLKVFNSADVSELCNNKAETINRVHKLGNIHIPTIIVSAIPYINDSAYIDGGTGKITVDEGRIKNAEIDVGVGVFEMKARLDGDSEIDCGIGRTVLKLSGLSDEYCLCVSKGIGSAVVDGVSVSDETYIGNGSSFVTVSGGIGSIEIIFVEN